MLRIRRILHATDFSSASKRALDTAVDLARKNKAELVLAHVLVPNIVYPADSMADPVFYVEIEKTTRRQAEAHLQKLVGQVQKARVKVKGLLLRGTAHEQIVRAAKNRRADMIVIGTHGRTGLKRLLLGSVAARVVAEAITPVLSVRGR